MPSPDLTKLNRIIDEESANPKDAILLRDTFALACYLHLKVDEEAGLKLCSTLFDKLGRDSRKTYFSEILASIPGNEIKFASSISCHAEINKLFKNNP